MSPHAPLKISCVNRSSIRDVEDLWVPAVRRGDAWLFNSEDWLRCWWKHFGKHSRLIELRRDGQDSSDFALLHRYWTLWRGLLPVRRMEFVGNHWNSDRSCPSELLGIPFPGGLEEIEAAKVWEEIIALGEWDEFLFSNIHGSREQIGALKEVCKRHGLGFAVGSINASYFVDRRSTWEDYKKRLTPNLRRKMINHRNRKNHEIELAVVEDEREIVPALEILENLIGARFGSYKKSKIINDFFKDVCFTFFKNDGLRLSVLKEGGVPISALLCLIYGENEFFLRLGIDEGRTKGLSPGLLHLGYEIESALNSQGRFWLLSGRGRATNYKQYLGEPVPCVSFRIFRSEMLRRLWGMFKAYDG